MTQNNSKPIKSVGDFLQIVKKLYPKNELAFFRGQASNSYDVNSSFCRLVHDNKINDPTDTKRPYRLADKIFQEFKNNIPIYSDNNLLQNYSLNDLDMMIVAQHYGLATRLIDWTKSPLVALYFATEKEDPEHDCSVFMMYNVPQKHQVLNTTSKALSSNIKNEQRRMMDIHNYFETCIMENMEMSLSFGISKKLSNIINKYQEEEFISSPVQLSKEYLAMHFQTLVLKLASKSETIKCRKIFSQIQNNIDIVNYLTSLSNVKIYNDTTYVIEPLPINHRIKNQQGVLVFANEPVSNMITCSELANSNIITHTNIQPNDDAKNHGIFRIDIAKEHINEIHEELNIYGITKDFIYPELPSYTEIMQKRMVSQAMNGKI